MDGHHHSRPFELRLRMPDVQGSLGWSIAVIGSGVAGLTAAYAMSGRGRVTLYEADTRLGGHAHTHLVDRGDGHHHRRRLSVPRAQRSHLPNAVPVVRRVGRCHPRVRDVDVGAGRADRPGIRGSAGIRGLFASWQSARPRYLLMLTEILRFHRAASRLLCDEDADDHGDVGRISSSATVFGVLRRALHHTAGGGGLVVWQQRRAALPSAVPICLSRPPRHAVGLRLTGMANGERRLGTYVHAIASQLHEVCVGTAVHSLRRLPDGVLVQAGACAPRFFDAAVVAVHPDQALLLLDDPTPESGRCSGRFRIRSTARSCIPMNRSCPRHGGRPRFVELPHHAGQRSGIGHL